MNPLQRMGSKRQIGLSYDEKNYKMDYRIAINVNTNKIGRIKTEKRMCKGVLALHTINQDSIPSTKYGSPS